jgi:hypothetical protein
MGGGEDLRRRLAGQQETDVSCWLLWFLQEVYDTMDATLDVS